METRFEMMSMRLPAKYLPKASLQREMVKLNWSRTRSPYNMFNFLFQTVLLKYFARFGCNFKDLLSQGNLSQKKLFAASRIVQWGLFRQKPVCCWLTEAVTPWGEIFMSIGDPQKGTRSVIRVMQKIEPASSKKGVTLHHKCHCIKARSK